MCCKLCKEPPVYKEFCSKHFIDYFENKVKNTIEKFKLFNKKDKIAVAVSGGKDSMAVLTILTELGYNVVAISVNEGIKGFRDKTLDNVKKFCEKNKITWKVYTYEKEYGKGLDGMSFTGNPCSTCGVLRRNLLNKYSHDFDVLATGHNLDDEAQAVVMNLLKNNTDILRRLGPISGITSSEKLTKRVKPLYLCYEREVVIYAAVKKIKTTLCPCPNKKYAFRLRILRKLNKIEKSKPGTKENIINWFLEYKKNKKRDHKISSCTLCGEPSAKEVCNKCTLLKTI